MLPVVRVFGRYKSLEGWVNKDNQDVTVGIMGLGAACRTSMLVVLTRFLTIATSHGPVHSATMECMVLQV